MQQSSCLHCHSLEILWFVVSICNHSIPPPTVYTTLAMQLVGLIFMWKCNVCGERRCCSELQVSASLCNGYPRECCWRTEKSCIDGLVQDCSNSSALAMYLLQSCTEQDMKEVMIFQFCLLHVIKMFIFSAAHAMRYIYHIKYLLYS